MEKYGLLGGKLGHSMSPFIHAELFKISGRDAEYALYECDSADEFLAQNTLAGYNVTIPYKEDMYDRCASIHDSAQPYHAVNCVDSDMRGYNTDVDGFRRSVSEIESTFDKTTLLLGFGGVGKMIAKQYDPSKLTIAVRNLNQDKVDSIHTFCGECVRVVDMANIPDDGYHLVVNATPVGMYPNVSASPIDLASLSGVGAVYDTIYNPLETKLLSMAKSMGIPCKCGIDMLVYQAAVSHKYWYGAEFSSTQLSGIVEKVTAKLRGKV